APPDPEVAALEGRVELVDRPLDQRFGLASRPVHRVDRAPVVDPAGRVPLEQRVGYRGEEEIGGAEGLQEQPLDGAVLDVRYGNDTDEVIRELLGRHLVQPGPKRIGRAR